MDPAALVALFGYPALFLAGLVEGEAALVAGGYLAQAGRLDPFAVFACGYAAALVSDNLYFTLGRRYGGRMLGRLPRLQAPVGRALEMLGRRPTLVILGMRFLWGLRTALPFAIGMSRVSRRRFLALDMLSGAVWAAVFTAVGYGLANALEAYVDDLVHHWVAVLAALLVAATSAYALLRWRRLRRRGRDALTAAD
ncbi:DedA family protein [Coralloluteibacterium thermophilus]|uniref:DedA family protein n=1 Tax=Coralloluteibacterium thermophilum TaxID=2707049 RepID=A0ABV9NLU0_9GAMM